jgi:hypothetical protein
VPISILTLASSAKEVLQLVFPKLAEEFGLVPKVLEPESQAYQQLLVSLAANQQVPAQLYSKLGTPVYEPVWLELPPAEFPEVQDGRWLMPVAMVYELERAKHVERTTVSGLDGSVKETASMADWQIRFMGYIVSADGRTVPENELVLASRIHALLKPVGVVSNLLNALGIHSIVTDNIRLRVAKAMPGAMAFELSALSDTPLEITVNRN